jgi:REP element-mobilizing transposase RayT
MQRIRLTYFGALHHAMNRGHGGEKIFFGSDLKKAFVDILAETSRKLKIKGIACCLLDNHYHLVVENSSGQDSQEGKRTDDRYFDPMEKVIQEFERMKGIDVDEIDVGKYAGKRLRGELLVYLKDNRGLT